MGAEVAAATGHGVMGPKMTPGWRAINRRVERGQTADDAKYGKSGHGSVHHSLDSSEVASEFLSLSAVPDQSYAHVAKQHKEKQHHGNSSSSSSSDSQLPRTHGQSNSPRSGKAVAARSRSRSRSSRRRSGAEGGFIRGRDERPGARGGHDAAAAAQGRGRRAGANTAGLEYAEDATLVRDTILAAQEEYQEPLRAAERSGRRRRGAGEGHGGLLRAAGLREKSARRRRQAERIERAAVASFVDAGRAGGASQAGLAGGKEEGVGEEERRCRTRRGRT